MRRFAFCLQFLDLCVKKRQGFEKANTTNSPLFSKYEGQRDLCSEIDLLKAHFSQSQCFNKHVASLVIEDN